MAAVHGLIGTFDLDGDGGLAFLADWDLFVVAFDRLARSGGLVGSVGNAFKGGREEGKKWELTLCLG